MGHDLACYQPQLSEYMRVTNDVLDMLSPTSENYTPELLSKGEMQLVRVVRKSVVEGIGPMMDVEGEPCCPSPPASRQHPGL